MSVPARLAALGPSEDESAVLFADAPAVHLLVERLRCLQAGAWSADLTHPPVAGGPVLRRHTQRAASGALRVDIEDGTLVIAGAAGHLARLADDLAHYAEHNDLDEPGMHCHVDPGDSLAGDAWIAADSPSLMIAGWVPER